MGTKIIENGFMPIFKKQVQVYQLDKMQEKKFSSTEFHQFHRIFILILNENNF